MSEARGSSYLLSVVVPTYQRRASMVRLLDGLSAQTIPPDHFEVIVSIDGSDDGSLEAIDSYRAHFRLRAVWQENQGRAAACNHGVRVAEGELLVLLDDDMEPAPHCLAEHLAAHPPGTRRAIVGAAPIVVGDRSPPLVRFYAEGFNGRQERLGMPGRVLHFREAYSGNFSIRRDVFVEAGGFDQDFRVYGHEDYELALRLQRAGVELLFSRDAIAHQHYEKDFVSLAKDSISRGTTAVVFADKHAEVAPLLGTARARQGPRIWRWARPVLLVSTAVIPATSRVVICFVQKLERRESPRLRRVYGLALDYFYWLGVRSARRARARGSSPVIESESSLSLGQAIR